MVVLKKMLLMFAGMDDIRICVVVLGSVYVLSPVLKTLTDTISTDTIYAMTVRTGLSKLHCTMNLYERNNVKSGLLCGIQSVFFFKFYNGHQSNYSESRLKKCPQLF